MVAIFASAQTTPHLLVTTGVRFFQLTSFSTRASLSLGQPNSSPLVLCVTVIAVASLSGFEDGFFVSKNKAVPSYGREGKKERAHTKPPARVMPCRLSVIRRGTVSVACRLPANGRQWLCGTQRKGLLFPLPSLPCWLSGSVRPSLPPAHTHGRQCGNGVVFSVSCPFPGRLFILRH